MNRLIASWEAEEKAALSPGDTSGLEGRLVREPMPWDYKKWLKEFLKKDTRLLDMETGVGNFLLGLNPVPELTAVTESHPASYQRCLRRLAPLGIRVEPVKEGDKVLPFVDESFDLVINLHGCYDLREVRRVLKNGGHFVTEQMGAQSGIPLINCLGLEKTPDKLRFNLENETLAFGQAGFRVVRRNQSYTAAYFTEVGALCRYAKSLPGIFRDFSVTGCEKQLLELQGELERKGRIPMEEHHFILIGKKING